MTTANSNGFTAKIVKVKNSYYDLMHLFYKRNDLTPEQKCRIAVSREFMIPKEYVEVVRKMYLNNTLGMDDKMYFICESFEDKDMRTLETHPQFEHNPKFPREYPRRVKKKPKIILESKQTIYREAFTEEYLMVLKNRAKIMKEMPIPKYVPNKSQVRHEYSTVEDEEEKQNFRLLNYQYEEENVITQKKSIEIDISDSNNVTKVKYIRMLDANEEPCELNCAEVDIEIELFKRSSKLIERKENLERQNKMKKFCDEVTNVYGADFIKSSSKYYGSECVRFSYHSTRKYLDNLAAIEKEKKEKEEREKMKWLPVGEKGDKHIIEIFSTEEEEDNEEQFLSILEPSSDSDSSFQAREIENLIKTSEVSKKEIQKIQTENEENNQPKRSCALEEPEKESKAIVVTTEKSPLHINVDHCDRSSQASFVSSSTTRKNLDPSNPWTDIIIEAEDRLQKIESASHSINSSKNSLDLEKTPVEIEVENTVLDNINKNKKPRGRPKKRKRLPISGNSGKKMGRPKKNETTLRSTTSNESSKYSECWVAMETRRATDKARNHLEAVIESEEITPEIFLEKEITPQPDIVVESLLPPAQPHQFPRPDLKPFVVPISSCIPSTSSGTTIRPVLEKFVVPHQFARPDCEPFMAPRKKRSGQTTVETSSSIKKFEAPPSSSTYFLDKTETLSQHSVTISVESDDAPVSKKAKQSTEESIEDGQSGRSIGSVRTPSSTKLSRNRRRAYISKYNPKPRNRRTEELAAGDGAVSSGASAGDMYNDSDDAVSRASSQSWRGPCGAPRGISAGLNSCTSSVIGDQEFTELQWPGTVKSEGDIWFGDPQPPKEYTIDEESEQKPDINELPTPPPINETSRKSFKWKTNIRERHAHENEAARFSQSSLEPKREINDEEIIPVQADYKVPKNKRTPIVEKGFVTPSPRYTTDMTVTHDFVMNHKIFSELNGLFVTDANKFCKFIEIVMKDQKREGMVYKFNVDPENIKSDFSKEFIQFVADTPKESVYSKARTYTEFTREFRKRCYLLGGNGDIKIGGKFFFGFIEKMREKMRRFRNCMPSNLMSFAEREMMTTVENMVIDRFIETTMKMASLSDAEGSTEEHLRRRLELVIRGWEEFVRKGGVVRVILCINRDDVKPACKEFMDLCQNFLKQTKINIENAEKLLELSESEFVTRTSKECGIEEDELKLLREDMRTEESGIHTLKCPKCVIGEKISIYFSKQEALDSHMKLHGGSECKMCFDDTPTPTLVLLHHINDHWSIINSYDFLDD